MLPPSGVVSKAVLQHSTARTPHRSVEASFWAHQIHTDVCLTPLTVHKGVGTLLITHRLTQAKCTDTHACEITWWRQNDLPTTPRFATSLETHT